MEIFSPLSRTQADNQFVIVMKDRYSELKRTVPLTKTTVLYVASIFFDHYHWIMTYGIPAYLLTGDGLHFVSKLFETLFLPWS